MDLRETNLPRRLQDLLDVLAAETIDMHGSSLADLALVETASLTLNGDTRTSWPAGASSEGTLGTIQLADGANGFASGASPAYIDTGDGLLTVAGGVSANGDLSLNGHALHLSGNADALDAITWDQSNRRTHFNAGIGMDNGGFEAFWCLARFHDVYISGSAGGNLYMNNGSGSGGGFLYMDSGDIVGLGSIQLSDGSTGQTQNVDTGAGVIFKFVNGVFCGT